MVERWLAKELDLSRKHEELLMRREALLRGTEAYYDTQDDRVVSFISDYSKAKERNDLLLKDIHDAAQELRIEASEPATPKFNTLKNNYWSMVRSVFPIWYKEYEEYERRKYAASSGQPSRVISNSAGSPWQGSTRQPASPRQPSPRSRKS